MMRISAIIKFMLILMLTLRIHWKILLKWRICQRNRKETLDFTRAGVARVIEYVTRFGR